MATKQSAGTEAGVVPNERKLFYGWVIVGTAFLCWFTADAFGWYTFGVFIGPITRDLGWTTTALTGALTLRMVVAGFIGPVIGPLADTKHGARILMTGGVLVAGAIPIAVSRIDELWQFYLLYSVFGAVGMVGFGGLVTNAVISKWFIKMRGRAIGIATIGISSSGVVFVQLSHYLISTYGWRFTLVTIGLLIWGIALLPVLLFVRRQPEDMGLRPDGVTTEVLANEAESVGEDVWTLKEALRTKALWLLLTGFNITGLALSGVFIHFFPFIEYKGFSADVAANAITTFAFCCAIVKIPWGLLAERIHVRYCITACYIGCALSLLILLNTNGLFFVFLYAVVYGIALGGDMVLRELVWADYFGRTFLGTIRGVVMPINLISMAGGPLFAAWLRDLTGSYQLPYTIFVVTTVTGTFFLFIAKPPQKES
ncbi:MAG: MFS transporter [Proteobacteria bacterium]|nr:MFS transporter [Pseudomonadota bacterium]